jgi:hypothetical protein
VRPLGLPPQHLAAAGRHTRCGGEIEVMPAAATASVTPAAAVGSTAAMGRGAVFCSGIVGISIRGSTSPSRRHGAIAQPGAASRHSSNTVPAHQSPAMLAVDPAQHTPPPPAAPTARHSLPPAASRPPRLQTPQAPPSCACCWWSCTRCPVSTWTRRRSWRWGRSIVERN